MLRRHPAGMATQRKRSTSEQTTPKRQAPTRQATPASGLPQLADLDDDDADYDSDQGSGDDPDDCPELRDMDEFAATLTDPEFLESLVVIGWYRCETLADAVEDALLGAGPFLIDELIPVGPEDRQPENRMRFVLMDPPPAARPIGDAAQVCR